MTTSLAILHANANTMHLVMLMPLEIVLEMQMQLQLLTARNAKEDDTSKGTVYLLFY